MFDEGFYYAAVRVEEGFLAAGPVSVEKKSEYTVHRYLERYHPKNDTFPVSVYRLKDMIELCSFVTSIWTNRTVKRNDIFSEDYMTHALEKEMTGYHLENSENDNFHYSYAMEQEMHFYFEHGRYKEYMQKGKEEKFSIDSMGKLADKNEKQYEYMCVCTITLSTRSAIRAGVLETRAYEISDIVLQQLSRAKNVLEMSRILEKGMGKLDEEICAALNDSNTNIYVEKSKNYIARHIYEKIQLEDVAKEIPLNPSYLSRVFKQNTGLNISQYILQEKIAISCNLLKYSDASIARIAEYMNLQPQSYFTKVFTQVKGISPGKYRIEQKRKLNAW